MDLRSNEEEALEAGEDGVFDLGDPSPPPSPVKVAKVVDLKLCSEKAAPLAEFSSKGVEQILERESPKAPEGENNLGEQEPLDSAASESTSGAVVGDDFKDAVERLQPEPHAVVANETAEGSTVSQETGVDRVAVPNTRLPDSSVGVAEEGVPPIEPPELASGKTETSSYIAAGLSNVRLPLPRQGATGRGMDSVVEADDTDGEGEFHDAYDTVADLVKDADKALEMKQAGNGHYKSGDFDEAADYYSMALEYCPEDEEHKQDRAVYLGNRAACHLQLKEYEAVVDDCTAALELNPRYVKALLRRAQANENLEKYDVALEDMKMLLEIDPNLKVAREGAPRLEKLHKEKMDKMKDEAIGKLKELGNSLLGHFGLSTDNFKMNQDPNTGSYSINFER